MLTLELTARGSGGVSVVAIVGTGALARVARFARVELTSGAVRLARLVVGGDVVDEALVVVISDEHVELHLHGSPPLVELVRRAFGDVDSPRSISIEARAADRLARAPCEAAARILLDQAEGAFRAVLRTMARLDGAEREALAPQLVERGRSARFVLERTTIVIAGPTNAGKSTLFNALVGERRALVDARAGTTRDLVMGEAALGAYPVVVIDTAGERPSSAEDAMAALERAGQALAREARAAADLVLWVVPVDWAHEIAPPRADALVLRSMADRSSRRDDDAISVRADPAGAIDVIARRFRARFELPPEPWSSGAAVPFDDESRAVARALAGLAAADASARIEQVLSDR